MQLCVALPGVKGDAWHHCAPLGNPWAFLMRCLTLLVDRFVWRDGKGLQEPWHVSTLIQSLHFFVTSFYLWFISVSRGKVCASWSVGQAGRPLFTVCEHYLSDVDLFATELLQRLGSALQQPIRRLPYVFFSSWKPLVSTFLCYIGP